MIKISSYLQYWDLNNLYDWAMSQRLPVNCLSGSKILLNLMKVSLKNYKQESNEGYSLKVDVQ